MHVHVRVGHFVRMPERAIICTSTELTDFNRVVELILSLVDRAYNIIKMAMMSSPGTERARDTRKRLESCWQLDLAWDKYPQFLSEVSAAKTAKVCFG